MIPERFREAVSGMLDERRYPLWWVEQQIASGAIMLMENDEAIIGVERRVYPGGAVELHGVFAAGNKSAIVRLVEQACQAGKQAGCDFATISSRPGWLRVLRDQGFVMEQQTISKTLREGVGG